MKCGNACQVQGMPRISVEWVENGEGVSLPSRLGGLGNIGSSSAVTQDELTAL